MYLEKLPFLQGLSLTLFVVFGGLADIGFFVDIAVWLVYVAGSIAFFCAVFFLFSNFVMQKIRRSAGKPIFPKASDKMRPLRIMQGIIFLLIGFQRLNTPVSLTPTFVSKSASNTMFGILVILFGIVSFMVVVYTSPQINEHGVFDMRGSFHPWEEIEGFVWESYAKRLIFKLKGKGYRKIVFDKISPETQSEISPYLEQHLRHTQVL